MNLKVRVKDLIKQSGISPRQRLGQSFIVDEPLLDRFVEYAEILPDEIVLEIGTGFGFLTERLSRAASLVHTIELDRKLCSVAKRLLKDCENVRVVEGDALKVPLPRFDKVVSNPPYAISSDLVFRLLGHVFKNAVLTFQLEFAKRLVAQHGTAEYGRLTVMVQSKAEVELVEKVPRESFYPMPKVDSIVTKITPRQAPFELNDREMFEELVRFMFTQRRRISKKVVERFALKRGLHRTVLDGVLKLAQLRLRVYELSPEDFAAISNALS